MDNGALHDAVLEQRRRIDDIETRLRRVESAVEGQRATGETLKMLAPILLSAIAIALAVLRSQG